MGDILARLIRVIQSLPADKLESLAHGLGIVASHRSSGELAGEIYDQLTSQSGLQRALNRLSANERLALMTIVSSHNGHCAWRQLADDLPFSAGELSKIVNRLKLTAMLQVKSHHVADLMELEVPTEIRLRLQSVSAPTISRRTANQSPSAGGTPAPARRVNRLGRLLFQARRRTPSDPASEITAWATHALSRSHSAAAPPRRASLVRLAQTLGLWENEKPLATRLEQWLALDDDSRKAIILRAWLHDPVLQFGGASNSDTSSRLAVRRALLATVAQGKDIAVDRPLPMLQAGLELAGIDRQALAQLPAREVSLALDTALRDLDTLKVIEIASDEGCRLRNEAARHIAQEALKPPARVEVGR